MGYDVYATLANANVTAKAMSGLDLVIVQDLYLTRTAQSFGHVFLPAAANFEKDGTFMNSERRVQRVRKVLEPPGDARPDWRIICDLARAMGYGDLFDFSSPAEIWNEIRSVWPEGAGMSYERLENGGLQWPCPDTAHPGTAVLHTEGFARSPVAPLACIDYRPSPETATTEYPYLLTTGRNLYQFNAGTMSMNTTCRELRPTDTLDVAPEDAAALHLSDGDRVCVRSRYGEVSMPLRISPAVKRGELFATFHDPTAFVNKLTGPYRDGVVGAPEYKLTCVRIESAANRT
jgi:formate dehydrogenase major subunit